MSHELKVFPTTSWGIDGSTNVHFESATNLPTENITSCFVYPVYQNKIVICKSPRGWGLPGGHREIDENPEDCARREALEEAAIKLGNLTLVGKWVAMKKFDSPVNKQYPQTAYQLLYFSPVSQMLEFKSKHETTERKLISIQDMFMFHHDYESVKDILWYVHKNYEVQGS